MSLGVASSFFCSDYLSKPVLGATRIGLIVAEGKLEDGPAILILDPNVWTLNQFGDTEDRSLMNPRVAPRVVECSLKKLKRADPLGLDRGIFEISPSDGTVLELVRLVSAVKNGPGPRLVVDTNEGTFERTVVSLDECEPDIVFLGNNTVPILRVSPEISESFETLLATAGDSPQNGSSVISTAGGMWLMKRVGALLNCEQVLSVDMVDGYLRGGYAHLKARGQTSTTGWSNARLSPVNYPGQVIPQDGICDYMFLAEIPGGNVGPALTDIYSEETPVAIRNNMKGVRVKSHSNDFVLRFLQHVEEYPKPIDWFEVLNLSMDNLNLRVDLRYSGGCARHDFELVWDKTYQESNPPRAVMRLLHNGHNDSCTALPSETLYFALPSLDPCIIRIEDGEGNVKDVRYGLD